MLPGVINLARPFGWFQRRPPIIFGAVAFADCYNARESALRDRIEQEALLVTSLQTSSQPRARHQISRKKIRD
jgi:hypothetical protein